MHGHTYPHVAVQNALIGVHCFLNNQDVCCNGCCLRTPNSYAGLSEDVLWSLFSLVKMLIMLCMQTVMPEPILPVGFPVFQCIITPTIP